MRDLKKYSKWIILPDDPWKVKWDLLITFLLFWVMFVTPYRIAFVEKDGFVWLIVDALIDFIFTIDIIFTFCSAYYNSKFILIDNPVKISINYGKSWFLIDLIAIVPTNALM